MTLRFGTDGVRGIAGTELTPELVLALGRAAARVLSPQGAGWFLARDTRRSGPMLAAALSAGLAAEGADVVDIGVLPTPAVAAMAADRAAAAAMISASHNPFADNGIKLFAAGGRKLDDVTEARVEDELARVSASPPPPVTRSGAALGRVATDEDAPGWYSDRVLELLEGRDLAGIRVAVDCAHGAAWLIGPEILAAAGADVVAVLGAAPDGTNINAGCGSTDPSRLAAAVVAEGADVGLAFDGDADRLIAVDGDGEVVDGDRLLAIFASDLRQRRRLRGDTVVVTVMTNLGFHRAMDAEGVTVHQTGVGDRQVLAALDEGGWSLGGEQSGHIIFADLATTGDGVLAGVALLDALARRGTPLADWAGGIMQPVPQILRNVTVGDRDGLSDAAPVWEEVASVEAEMAGAGRVLLRPSGTEPLVRVMVEAPTEGAASAAAERLEAVLRSCLGPPGPAEP